MSYILAIDQGTTSSRAVVYDRRTRVRAEASCALPAAFPRPGWVEQDPEEIWTSVSRAVQAVRRKLGAGAHAPLAVGLTNQRETTLVWDRATGRAIAPAIVWQDRRTTDLCARLRAAGHESDVRRRTGLPLDLYFSATKLGWILDRVPGARRRAERGELAFGTVDSWLLWKLTDGRIHVTDTTNAARTLLCNIRTGRWDDTLLQLFRVPRALLPDIRSCSEIYGEVAVWPEWRGVPIAGVAGDQHAALFGQACFTPDQAKTTYGTGCFLLRPTGTRPVFSRHGLLTTPAWRIGGRTEYALEGSVFVGGAAVQWLRDGLGMLRRVSDVERWAKRASDHGGVYVVPAFAGLGAPHWDADARGAIFGLTRGTTRAHIARATVESMAFQVADVVAAMEADVGKPLRELRVDGGAARNAALLQFQSDLLRSRVVRAAQSEATALGAAFFAGLAIGFWKEREALTALWRAPRVFSPQMPAHLAKTRREGWREAVRRVRGWTPP